MRYVADASKKGKGVYFMAYLSFTPALKIGQKIYLQSVKPLRKDALAVPGMILKNGVKN